MSYMICKMSVIARSFFAFGIFSLSSNVFSFDYNQVLYSYKDGIVAGLNNCGVFYSTNGGHLRGGGQSYTLSNNQRTLKGVAKVGAGLAYLFESPNALYYSKSGAAPTSGDDAFLIEDFSSNYQFEGMTEHKGSIVVYGYAYYVPLPNSTKYQQVAIIKNPLSSTNRIVNHIPISNAKIGYIGSSNGILYLQSLVSGSVYIVDDVSYLESLTSVTDFEGLPGFTRIHSNSSERIRQLTTYGNSTIALTDKGVYLSTNTRQIFAGSNVKKIYGNDYKISSLAEFRVETIVPITVSDIAVMIPVKKSIGLFTAFSDGTIYFSPSGNVMHGGGDSKIVARYPDATTFKSAVEKYAISSGMLGVESVGNINLDIFNYYDKKELSDRFFVGQTASMEIWGYISDFSGEPATARFWDKGWSGWEYEWRDKGTRTGFFNLETSGNIIGNTGFKARLESGCGIMTSVETASLEAISVTAVQSAIDYALHPIKTVTPIYKGACEVLKPMDVHCP